MTAASSLVIPCVGNLNSTIRLVVPSVSNLTALVISAMIVSSDGLGMGAVVAVAMGVGAVAPGTVGVGAVAAGTMGVGAVAADTMGVGAVAAGAAGSVFCSALRLFRLGRGPSHSLQYSPS